MSENKISGRSPLKRSLSSKIYNYKAIAENSLKGINRVVDLKLIIEGKSINYFHHFSLKQSVSTHHSFVLKLPFDALQNSENHELQESQNFLGKRLTAVFTYKDVEESPESTFVGIVTEVGYEQKQGSLGNIVITGHSPTILLDAAPHTQSFGGGQSVSLDSIADTVIRQGIDGRFDIRVSCDYQKNLGYSSQYNETHFNYLARMAEAYGEQFYYDGSALHFGSLPAGEKPVELIYGSNVKDICVKMRAVHLNPNFYGYNSSNNEKLTTDKSTIQHKSDIAQRAYNLAEKTFTTPSLRVAPMKASTFMDISTSQKGTAGSKASEVFITTGTTSLPFLFPGCVAEIKMREKESNDTSHFTKLMIIETEHEVDGRGNYNGNFTAIAADSGFLPRPSFVEPLAEAQTATVVSNCDPKNQGRVQVRFGWQLHDTTEWIRVMTPDAGGSDKVSKNRGFMAIPEVGDQVMVNFQHNHPDRPFVMGGMFHGQVGGGGGAGNNVKSLSSRSGNKLELNDGEGSVYLTDQGGANMKFDGAGNATTNANSDHSVVAGQNCIVKAGQDNSISAGNNNSISAGSNSTISVGGKDGGAANSTLNMDAAGNIFLEGKTSITIKVGDNIIVIDEKGITGTGKQVVLDASTNDLSLTSKGKMSINSQATLDVSATSNATISSGDTNIT